MSTVRNSILYSKLAAMVVVLPMLFASMTGIADDVDTSEEIVLAMNDVGGWEPEVEYEEEAGGWDPVGYVTSLFSHTQQVDERQVECLAKNIYHEARHESREGKLAVAQVTLNRTKHESYPDTVCGVVYHKTKHAKTKRTVCQFSWVCSSRIRNSQIKNSQLWDESVAIARQTLEQGVALATMTNALYYHATYVNPRWNLKRIKRIGMHIFYTEKRRR